MQALPPPTALIRAAKKAIGQDDDMGLAMRLRQRFGLRTTQSNVSRWRTSPRGPSYEPTVALLRVAGWLNEEQVARDLAQAEAEAARDAAEAADSESRRDEDEPPAQDERATG